MPIVTLVIVRHGETTANRDGIIQGQSEVPYALTATGLAQAQQAGAALSARHVACGGWSHVYTSDLHRTRQTTEAILKSAQEALEPDAETLPMPELTKLLREFDAGDRGDLPVGTSAEEAHRIKCAQTGVVSAMALGERKEDIIARVHAFVQHVLEAAVSGDEPVEVVVVSHGGFIKTFLQTLLGRPVDRVNNTSVSVVRLETKSNSSRAQGIKYSATAESLNDLSHLTKDVATTSSAW